MYWYSQVVKKATSPNKGKVYHYHGISYTEFEFEHDVYISIEDNHKMTMKWVGVKVKEDAEPVTLYLYDGTWEQEDESGYHIHCDATPQLPDGSPLKEWEEFDIDGWCGEESCRASTTTSTVPPWVSSMARS